MLNKFKKNSVKFSLIAILAISPSALFSASGSGVIDGSSESSSAMIEGPNVEQQVNRTNVGIAMVRLNTVILHEMPISGDSKWVDELTTVMTPEMYKKIKASDAVKKDPYFSTAMITNAILNRPALGLSPLNARVYLELNTIYKNSSNAPKNKKKAYRKYSIPDIYALPSFSNMASFTNFPKKNNNKRVQKIEVNASKFKKYKNVEMATISLAPKKYAKRLLKEKKAYEKAKNEVAKIEGNIKLLEAWLDNDKNIKNPSIAKKKAALAKNKEKLNLAEIKLDEEDKKYTLLMEDAAEEIGTHVSNDFEKTKVPLARKLEKLLDTVDNNAIGAVSMFTAASVHLMKNGLGTLDDEIRALTVAQGASKLLGSQKKFLATRLERMGKGALMALPNIAIGSYYAVKQSSEAGRYQILVNKVLEVAEVNEEARKEAAEALALKKASK